MLIKMHSPCQMKSICLPRIFLSMHCIWDEHILLLKGTLDSKRQQVVIIGKHAVPYLHVIIQFEYFSYIKLCALILDFISSPLPVCSSQVSIYILKLRWFHLDFIIKCLLSTTKRAKTLKKKPKEKWSFLENFIFLLEDVIKVWRLEIKWHI